MHVFLFFSAYHISLEQWIDFQIRCSKKHFLKKASIALDFIKIVVFTVHVDYFVATWLVGIEISALSKRGWYSAKHSSLWQWVREPSNSLWVPISQSDSDPTRCSLCYCILENKAKMNNRVIWMYQRAGSWIIAFQLVNCGCPLPVCPCLFVSLAFGPLILTFFAASLSGSSGCFFFFPFFLS